MVWSTARRSGRQCQSILPANPKRITALTLHAGEEASSVHRLVSLSHSESLLGGMLRRSECWQEEAKGWWSFGSYAPAFGSPEPFTAAGILYTSDEAQVDFWLTNNVRQHLVLSSILGPYTDPRGKVRLSNRFVFVLQAGRSMIVIQNQQAAQSSRLLRYVLGSVVTSGGPGERNELKCEARVAGPLDFGLPPRMRSEEGRCDSGCS